MILIPEALAGLAELALCSAIDSKSAYIACHNRRQQSKAYRFGDAYLTDAGALLPRTNILGRQTLVFCQWSDIRYSETYYDLILRTSNS